MSNYIYKLLDLFDTKNRIKTSIEEKGVEIGDDVIFKEYPNYINKIKTGGGSGIGEYDLGVNAFTLETYCGNKVSSMYRTFMRNMSVGSSIMYYPQYIIGADIGESVITAEHAYDNCISLEHANIRSKVLTDMNYTFYRCDNLKTCPDIPNSVTNMAYAFMNCVNMTGNVNIPVDISKAINVYKVYDSCYNITGCPVLQNRSIAEQMNLGNASYLFNACYNLSGNYYVPSCIGNTARMFLECGSISHVVIPHLKSSSQAAFTNTFFKNVCGTENRLNVWIENYTQFTYAAKTSVAVNLLPTLTAESGSLIIDGVEYPYNNYVYSETSNVYIYGP